MAGAFIVTVFSVFAGIAAFAPDTFLTLSSGDFAFVLGEAWPWAVGVAFVAALLSQIKRRDVRDVALGLLALFDVFLGVGYFFLMESYAAC